MWILLDTHEEGSVTIHSRPTTFTKACCVLYAVSKKIDVFLDRK